MANDTLLPLIFGVLSTGFAAGIMSLILSFTPFRRSGLVLILSILALNNGSISTLFMGIPRPIYGMQWYAAHWMSYLGAWCPLFVSCITLFRWKTRTHQSLSA